MVTLLHMLLAEADRSLDGCETVCQDLLEVLLIWLVRCTTLSLQVEESPRSDNRECVEIKRYLDNNYREEISLDTLAEVAHINKYYLAHTFQKAYGISPITYLTAAALRRANICMAHRLQPGADQRADGIFLPQLLFAVLPQGGRPDPQRIPPSGAAGTTPCTCQTA